MFGQLDVYNFSGGAVYPRPEMLTLRKTLVLSKGLPEGFKDEKRKIEAQF